MLDAQERDSEGKSDNQEEGCKDYQNHVIMRIKVRYIKDPSCPGDIVSAINLDDDEF